MTTQDQVPSLVRQTVNELALVDHHVHGALRDGVDRPTFESMITEGPKAPSAATQFDSQVGFAIRRWCAPLLDLPVHASADDYWQQRCRLGESEVNRRLLGAAGIDTFLLETGYLGDAVLNLDAHGAESGSQTREVVRLETLAETLLRDGATGRDFVRDYPDRLVAATADAVGVKSVLAYRHGFDVPPDRPTDGEVIRTLDRIRRDGEKVDHVVDPVVLRYLLWCGVDRGLPIQLHCGYGDPDLDLHRANPVLLMDWLREVEPTGVPVMLLHNYPYHREAGYLAQVFDNVYFDVGLGINYTGVQSRQVIAESLELAPFHKQLFSSDGWGPSELHYLGATLWRRGMADVVERWVAEGDWSEPDAIRVVQLIGRDNARRVYGL